MELLSETVYGTDPGGSGVFPAFMQGDQWTVRRREVIGTNASRGGFGTERRRATIFRGSFEAFRTYLYDRGPAELAWTMLLEAAGCRRRDANTWEAAPGRHRSLTLRDYRDGARRIITGCRSQLVLRTEAGGPVQIDAGLSGRAALDTATALSTLPLDLPAPAQFCDVGFVISVLGWAPVTPRLDAVELDLGTVLIAKRASSAAEARLEWRIGDVAPSVRCVIEAEPDRDWEAARGRMASIQWSVGTASRWAFEVPRLDLADDPEIVRLGSGAEGVALVFRCHDGSGPALRITRTPG